MSLPHSRPAMRLLSSRLRHIHRLPTTVPAAAFHQSVRSPSRYSNPSSRSSAAQAIPEQQASFIGRNVEESEDPIERPSNLSEYARERQELEDAKAYHRRRIRFSAFGLFFSVAGLAATLYMVDLDELEKKGKNKKTQLDASRSSNDKFHGREVHVIGAGDGKRIVAEDAQEGHGETELVETGTSSVPYFPRYMYLPSSANSGTSTAAPNSAANPGNIQNEEEYTLVGLGIRKVSFLGIQVYVLGLYIRTQDISTLQSQLIHAINPDASTLIPSEKDALKQKLLDADGSTQVWESLLKQQGIKSAWRVVPTRNTDFAHLRDGWITGIKKGMQAAKQRALTPDGPASEYEDESFGAAMKEFKDLFVGGGAAPKGSILMLVRDAAGSLEVLFQKKEKETAFERMGKVGDDRVARLLWLGYLAGKNVSSEAARQGVVDGCVRFAGRPVGSVETMVI